MPATGAALAYYDGYDTDGDGVADNLDSNPGQLPTTTAVLTPTLTETPVPGLTPVPSETPGTGIENQGVSVQVTNLNDLQEVLPQMELNVSFANFTLGWSVHLLIQPLSTVVYALDLAGSALGALLVVSLYVPSVGVPVTCAGLAALKALGALSRRRGSPGVTGGGGGSPSADAP